MLEELMESPAFWILGGMGVAMELIGWIVGKKMGLGAFPFWQLLNQCEGSLVA